MKVIFKSQYFHTKEEIESVIISYGEKKIKVLMDNHKIHTSIETREYLKTVLNKFEFVFTPKHASWLSIIESFFRKMARSVLRGIRVDSIKELGERIGQYIDQVNEKSVIFTWKYKMEKNCGLLKEGTKICADSGYCSGENIHYLNDKELNPYIPEKKRQLRRQQKMLKIYLVCTAANLRKIWIYSIKNGLIGCGNRNKWNFFC
ncbi:Mobile element protein [Methanosarcina sp. WH1]|nr:Mobile element protein [Methanosarcina sp. WH1]